MSTNRFFLKNAAIVNEGLIFKGDVLINNGIIEKIFRKGFGESASLSDEVKTIDLNGLHLFPGVIDDQVHFREPGLTRKADIYTESKAAIAGGITSFMEMPNTSPATITQKLLGEKFELGREKSLANYSFYMGATNSNFEELAATDIANVCGIKIFMGSSTGNMLVDNPDSLNKIFRDIKLPLAVHCEDEQTIRANLEKAKEQFGEEIPPQQHAVIRNHDACEKSSRLAVSLAEKYETRLHLLHLSTANELRFLDNSTPLEEKRITAEVCVHHLWFSGKDYSTKGNFIKWNPSIKTENDRISLISGLLEGYLDVVATDHAPHTLEEKQNPYLQCPSGGPMVQHALPAMLEFYHKGIMSLEKIVEVMCHHPAICFNVKNRGFIREGYAADLAVINTNQPYTVEKSNLLYKCGWSPLEGTRLNSSVVYTFVNGYPVYERGHFNESVKGQALQFSR